MRRYRLANAPCSWGTIENSGDSTIGHAQMLDELAWAGYTGTELGDWGFMPTEPARLREALESRGLALVGSWVTVRLHDAAHHAEGVERALGIARLLAEVGGPDCTVNIGDDHGNARHRFELAGRIRPEHGLDDAGWEVVVEGASRVAEAVLRETGLRSALHPHGATYVETPDEIDEFLRRTDPDLLGIVYDTGHYMLGGGDPVAGVARFAGRIRLAHLKDFDPAVLAAATERGWDYRRMVGEGVFSELGRGAVDFPGVLAALDAAGYDGWVVVEQDVLPNMGEPRASAKRNRDYLASLGQ